MSSTLVDHVDVLIVGAGISGIGAAHYLQKHHPQRRYAILEAREDIGGTWDLFRYPGIRSDSDLATFGYAFKPWTGHKSIADGDAILAYLRETVAENSIEQNIRFQHKVVDVSWSTPETCWTIVAERTDTGETVTFTATWLFCATGYYRYDEGYTPEFLGRERFGGEIVHPQAWPEDLDYEGKRVVVIGSGATAVTLVPTLARTAAHVTMLQRSPSYIVGAPAVDRVANLRRRLFGPERGHEMTRRRNAAFGSWSYRSIRAHPRVWKRLFVTMARLRLPRGYDVGKHFTPDYDPWDQRVCLAPNGDFFKAIKQGAASVVTDHIETFDETGITLKSGEHLDADIIITATGLDLVAFGGIPVTIDGIKGEPEDTFTFKGMMLTEVPNFAYAIGYTNASWTLKVDLACEHFCRLLHYMDNLGYVQCRPVPPPEGTPSRPVLDFDAGYILRAAERFPLAADIEGPWGQSMDYLEDRKTLLNGPVDDHMQFLTAEQVPAVVTSREDLVALV